VEAHVEKELNELIELASTIMSEGRKPTDGERARFEQLSRAIASVKTDWKLRLVDQIDRFAAMLEGMGI